MPEKPEYPPEIIEQARKILDGEMTFEQAEEALIGAIGSEREQFWRDTLYLWSTMVTFKDDNTLKAELYNVGTSPEQMKEIFEKVVPLLKFQQSLETLNSVVDNLRAQIRKAEAQNN